MEVTTSQNEHLPAETRDISSVGMLFQVNADVAEGSNIEFTITMPAEVLGAPTNVQVNGVGRVVRSYHQGERRAIAAVIEEYRFERA